MTCRRFSVFLYYVKKWTIIGHSTHFSFKMSDSIFVAKFKVTETFGTTKNSYIFLKLMYADLSARTHNYSVASFHYFWGIFRHSPSLARFFMLFTDFLVFKFLV